MVTRDWSIPRPRLPPPLAVWSAAIFTGHATSVVADSSEVRVVILLNPIQIACTLCPVPYLLIYFYNHMFMFLDCNKERWPRFWNFWNCISCCNKKNQRQFALSVLWLLQLREGPTELFWTWISLSKTKIKGYNKEETWFLTYEIMFQTSGYFSCSIATSTTISTDSQEEFYDIEEYPSKPWLGVSQSLHPLEEASVDLKSY